ncbi:helix-turn-helix domain-containing protein [Polyangium spumosum]|uniref:Helix-turn-helix domain-containing protein n=1 Tax=Polyangium spumosum TaxID=889282 RepID=A0A6N7Q2L9_9BACT|nr:helix-turn-helix domain-containing protein [Polyangium spumosum]
MGFGMGRNRINRCPTDSPAFGNKRDAREVGTSKAHAQDFPRLLSVDQVATLLGLSTRTVRRLIKAGDLVAYRINRQVRVDAASVTHLLEASRTETSERAYSCRARKENTRSASRTSSADEAKAGSGLDGSTAAKFPSARRTASRPSASSTSSSPDGSASRLPQTAEELRKALRRLRHPS